MASLNLPLLGFRPFIRVVRAFIVHPYASCPLLFLEPLDTVIQRAFWMLQLPFDEIVVKNLTKPWTSFLRLQGGDDLRALTTMRHEAINAIVKSALTFKSGFISPAS